LKQSIIFNIQNLILPTESFIYFIWFSELKKKTSLCSHLETKPPI
jgi:hypothetical protein